MKITDIRFGLLRVPLKTPFKAKQTALEVFDPSYFIDFKFDDKDPIKLNGAPAGPVWQGARLRTGEPSGGSRRTTSAPRSARRRPA